ncbi:MAG: hypothetical protein R3E01_36220 [Pirellulaceae bacterium]|nr:hypothetical protein [Planctomycetales bacterium]
MQATLHTSDLAQFTGDIIRYAHPLNRQVVYTHGVRYVAEHGHAYWLIDAIVSYYGTRQMQAAFRQDPRTATMHFWRLTVTDGSAVLVAQADAGEEPFIRQVIAFTDFPLQQIDIWAEYDGAHWTLYLPSEH